MRIYIVLIIIIIFGSCAFHNHKEENVSRDSLSWAKRMANNVISNNDTLLYYNGNKKIKWQYDIAMLGQAIDKLGYIDARYSKYMEDYINYFINEDGSVKQYKIEDYNLDNINPAKNLFTLYKRTGEEKYLIAIKSFIRQLEEQPRTKSGGFWHKKIYPWQMWLDGVYMSSPFMAQYAKEFDAPGWFDTVIFQITHIYDMALDKRTGLLYHAWNENKQERWCNPETGQSGYFWGRAMGWYSMAIVDVLDYLPRDHPGKDKLIDILNNISKALLKVRDTETGLWYQVLDQGAKEGNYLEASCSAMFTYVFAKGAKKGYLQEDFLKIANESFNSIIKEFVNIRENDYIAVMNVCGGCGLGGNPYRDGSFEYYINEKKVENDEKGVAPFILAALELNR